MKSMINRSHIEGLLYEHNLELKVTGDRSKNPGTPFITGSISIATDDAITNIVQVHYTYITEKTTKGTPNTAYGILKDIIDEKLKSVMKHGAEVATQLRIDSSIGLNEFYSEVNGEVTLISRQRNEGGFIHITQKLDADEKTRNTFESDIIIFKTVEKEANPEKKIERRLEIHGVVFDYKKSALPVTYVVSNPQAISYFLRLEANANKPVFTKVRGRQISETLRIEEEGAFGDKFIREVPGQRKSWLVTWAQKNPYIFGSEDITKEEYDKVKSERAIYLSELRQRYEDYVASKNSPVQTTSTAAVDGGFNF